MTTKPKVPKFRIRGPSGLAPQPETPAKSVSQLTGGTEDGFGNRAFPGSAKSVADGNAESSIAEIRRENLTGRQLRMARRLAQRHGMKPSSDFDAVRLLREAGIDPFDRANMVELVHARDDATAAGVPQHTTGTGDSKPQIRAGLPQTVDPQPNKLPGKHIPQSAPPGLHDIERIQRDIVRRRRRNLMFLVGRLVAFVLLPTLACMYYFAFIATPSYGTKSEFIVQQAEAQAASGGLLGGTAMATSQDSILVQDFLTSREAMQKLDQDHGYREHFSDPSIDSLQRIPADASNEALYKHYKKNVKIGYDPTEGVLRMEVTALTPEMSRVFSEALIGYAEDRVDQITERKRGDQMRGATEAFADAEAKMVAAQEKVVELQEQLGVLDPESETAGLMSQINTLEVQLSEKKLTLSQLLDNQQPNRARVAGAEGDIERLEALIAQLRSQMTNQGRDDGSLATVSARLRMAEVDLETRTMVMQESLQQLEAARIDANRQVRFLSIGVTPVPPDEPTYPKVFENTLIAFLIFGALYLLTAVTAGILREQVSS